MTQHESLHIFFSFRFNEFIVLLMLYRRTSYLEQEKSLNALIVQNKKSMR